MIPWEKGKSKILEIGPISGVETKKNKKKMAKKPFSLTYVVYDEEDGIIGWLMALTSLSPV